MEKSNPTSPVYVILTVALALMAGSAALYADQVVTSDDGREVLLNTDGTWEFRSTDRHANTKDGRRVRLRDDHTWEYVGNAPSKTEGQMRSATMDIQLERGVIESHEKKRLKNILTRTQTVFYLRVKVSSLAAGSVKINHSEPSRITVTDNRGNAYPVLAVTPAVAEMKPGSEQVFAIRTDGSPSILSMAKTMLLELGAGSLGNAETTVFKYRVYDLEKQKVGDFD